MSCVGVTSGDTCASCGLDNKSRATIVNDTVNPMTQLARDLINFLLLAHLLAIKRGLEEATIDNVVVHPLPTVLVPVDALHS